MNFITKKIQKCFFLCCFIATIGTINAQGTYTPSGRAVTLTTKAQVTDLGTAIGTNTIFNGSVTINESSTSTDSIDDLSIFSGITQINGFLNIMSTKSLTILSHETSTSGEYAFNALETIGGSFYVGNRNGTTSLTNIGNFPKLSSVVGDFFISNNDSLTIIESFPALETIGANMGIGTNPMLGVIEGFPVLTSVSQSFSIRNHDVLTNIGDYPALISVGNTFTIGGINDDDPNDILTTLGDFSALQRIEGGIVIFNNPMLSSCCSFPSRVMRYVGSAGRTVRIGRNAAGCTSGGTGAYPAADSEICVTAYLNITRQSTVNAFLDGLTRIDNGALIISRAVNDISATNNVTKLDYLVIKGTTALNELSKITTAATASTPAVTEGLYNLREVGNITVDNTTLDSLGIFPNLISMGSLSVSSNDNLTTLGTFDALTSIGGHLVIRSNDELTDLGNLSALETIGAYLRISDNEKLTDLGNLSALETIGAYLRISDNEKLTDLGDLSALTSIGESDDVFVPSESTNTDGVSIIVEANTILAACCNLTNLLPGQANAVTGSVFINSNAEGCNTADTGTDIEKVTAFVEACEATVVLSATGITAPTGTETNYTASAAAAGDTLTIDITLENATGWEVMITGTFVTSAPTMGNNDVDAVLTIAENTTTAERTDTITFTSTGGEGTAATQTLVITQLAAGGTLPTLTIASTGITAPTGGATAYTADAVVAGEMLTIDITLENATGWEVMITGAFVTSTPTMGNNDDNAVLTIAENTTTAERTDTITFTSTGGDATVSQTLIITQAAAEPTLEITGINARSITSEAGTEDIIIASNTDFRVSTSDDLVTSLTFTSESGSAGTPIVPSNGSITLEGMGNGTLQIAYSANTTTAERTGTLTLSALDGSNVLTTPTPITITLTQEAPATSPRLRIAASGITAPAGSETNYTYNASVAGDTLTIDVTLTGGATDWTVIADAFVTSAPTTGNNDVDAVLTITENTTTDERMATLIFTSSGGEGKIDTQTLVITQAAAAKIMLTSHAEGDSIAIAHDNTDPITIDFTLGGSATGWKDTIIYMPDTTNFVTMDTLKEDTISITITPSVNTSAAPRTATITLITTGHEGTPDSVSLTITQGVRADTTVTLPPKDTTTTLYSYTRVDFSLYPNPTKGNLTIEGVTGYLQVYVHDLVGREIMTYSLTPSNKTIDVSNLPSGMYVVTVQAEDKTWTEVLIIVN